MKKLPELITMIEDLICNEVELDDYEPMIEAIASALYYSHCVEKKESDRK